MCNRTKPAPYSKTGKAKHPNGIVVLTDMPLVNLSKTLAKCAGPRRYRSN